MAFVSLVVFWGCLFFIFYTYPGYTIYLFILARILPRHVRKRKEAVLPTVSVVIAAKNEEKNIIPRLKNLLEQEYPKDKMELIVVSDGSTDSTEKLVEKFGQSLPTGSPELVCLSQSPSSGKPAAINYGIEAAKGDLIVFADCRQRFSKDAILELAENFADPEVGCVSGELTFSEGNGSDIKLQMGAYWRYEKLVRKLESQSGSVIGATGAIYAIRKELYQQMPRETLLDDVFTPMSIISQGYRVVFESKAKAFDSVSKDISHEWDRKVRTLAGNWQLFNIKPALFSPMQNPLWWRFMSHKIFRLIVPFFLPLLLASAILLKGIFYNLFAWLQVFFYLLAVLGQLVPKTRSFRLISFSYFFIVLNLAALRGFVYWFTGNCNIAWKAPSLVDGKGK